MTVLTPADSNNLCNIRTSLFICRLCIIYQNLLLAVGFVQLKHTAYCRLLTAYCSLLTA